MVLLQQDNTELGHIKISMEVLEFIASHAAKEIKNIRLENNFASGNFEKLGKKYRGRGIRIEQHEDSVSVDAFVSVKKDINISKKASEIQSTIKSSMKHMTGIEVKEVNVHILYVQLKK
ncbi:putative alkaline shock family protein YloU [Abyssicoccus albus]|uniref:Putative alkaline shock family protein YloU n=1 Tax=Abyssicoccus albus TaxID=1817405 RepID=A0A3N5BK65_9BACL|nr:putative alkaline shock family protein YloU [Abyssicoccus albus]